jgi:tRNA-modifying protein YgfZ
MSINLPSYSLLELSGADAAAFAQAQFCSDVTMLGDGQWQWSAWLSPQGRVRAFFALLRFSADRLQLVLRGGDAEAITTALRRFVLRAKVVVRVMTDRQIVGVYDVIPDALDRIESDGDQTTIALSATRALALEPVTRTDELDTSLQRWRLADIRDGLIDMSAALDDSALPQWLGLQRLGTVSVRKGCYPGQEIMSRLHFKGGNKRSLYRVGYAADVLPAPGSAIVNDAAARVGHILQSERADDGAESLAILSHDAADGALHIEASARPALRILDRFE